jgi:hypothetical protein
MNTRILLALVALTAAQLPAKLAAITGNRGVSMGHLHLVVRDVDAHVSRKKPGRVYTW